MLNYTKKKINATWKQIVFSSLLPNCWIWVLHQRCRFSFHSTLPWILGLMITWFCLYRIPWTWQKNHLREEEAFFLAHLTRRVMWAIAITWLPSSSLAFHISIFSSETTGPIKTKLYRNDVRKVLYKVSSFCADRTINMATKGNTSFWLAKF